MIKRILIAIPVLIGITIIDYAIMCLAGSPLQMLQGPRISQAAVAAKEIAPGQETVFFGLFLNFATETLPCRNADRVHQHKSGTELKICTAFFCTLFPIVHSFFAA